MSRTVFSNFWILVAESGHMTALHVVCTGIGGSQRTVTTLDSLVKYSEGLESSLAQ